MSKPTTIGIYINSSGRASWIRTTEQLPRSWKDIVHIVVPHAEFTEYKKNNRGWNIIALPPDCPPYLSSQRQWVTQHAEEDYIWMMDDDLRFRVRTPDDPEKLTRKTTTTDMGALYTLITDLANIDWRVIGVSVHAGNHVVPEDFTYNTRVTRCFCFCRKTYNKLKINLAPYEPFAMQDFLLGLSFLYNGYSNIVIYKYMQDEFESSTKRGGGCARYRSTDVMFNATKYLQRKFPGGIVQIKNKRSKAAWGARASGLKQQKSMRDGDQTMYSWRPDVIVNWQKAYEIGCKRTGANHEEGKGISSFLDLKKGRY